jgi:hypothetical protein
MSIRGLLFIIGLGRYPVYEEELRRVAEGMGRREWN